MCVYTYRTSIKESYRFSRTQRLHPTRGDKLTVLLRPSVVLTLELGLAFHRDQARLIGPHLIRSDRLLGSIRAYSLPTATTAVSFQT